MRVAEQVYVRRSTASVGELFGADAAAWIRPFAQLAWSDAQFSLRRRHVIGPTSATPGDVAITVSASTLHDDQYVVALTWVAGGPEPFRRFDGVLGVRVDVDAGGTVLELVGDADVDVDADPALAAVTGAELAIRLFLGHLRLALDAGA